MNYPTSLDNGSSLPNPGGTDKQNSPDHAGLHTSENQAIIALEGKTGIGASTPTANTLLFGTGTGTSAWTQLTSAQLAASLSDETGTGAVVFANTPTLITPKVDTINESTPSNGVTVGGVSLKSGAVNASGAITAGTGLTVSAGTVTAPNGSLSSKVLTNPYKFSATLSTATNTGNAAFAKVPFNVKDFDTGSNYDNVTNFRFTAPIAGFYFFNARVSTTGSLTVLIASLYRNGVEHSRGVDTRISVAASLGSTVSSLIQLAASDYIEVFSYGSAATAIDVLTPRATYFQSFLVSNT